MNPNIDVKFRVRHHSWRQVLERIVHLQNALCIAHAELRIAWAATGLGDAAMPRMLYCYIYEMREVMVERLDFTEYTDSEVDLYVDDMRALIKDTVEFTADVRQFGATGAHRGVFAECTRNKD